MEELLPEPEPPEVDEEVEEEVISHVNLSLPDTFCATVRRPCDGWHRGSLSALGSEGTRVETHRALVGLHFWDVSVETSSPDPKGPTS